jgi:hypothetical protein
MWSDKLGEAVKACAKEQCPDGYPMEFHGGSDDYDAFEAAVEQGIDSYLEAVEFKQGTGQYHRARFVVTPETLHVLVRRLLESDNEHANSLASSICETLEIELI